MNKLTEWFPPSIKPVHVGPYQRKFEDYVSYAWWDGESFSVGQFSPTAFGMYGHPRSSYQNRLWRGLAVKP
jgi:hypothetical protein